MLVYRCHEDGGTHADAVRSLHSPSLHTQLPSSSVTALFTYKSYKLIAVFSTYATSVLSLVDVMLDAGKGFCLYLDGDAV